jgi:hypothetical protein
VATGDINADGEPDLIWQHDDGWLAVWTMRGALRLDVLWLSPNRVPDPRWRVRGAADLNHDGAPDLILQHQGEGWLGVWLMVGTSLVDGQLLHPARMPSPDWMLTGAADIDRDGSPDLVWQNRETGQLAAWYMNGAVTFAVGYLSPDRLPDREWRVVGLTDLNGDGSTDLVLQHLSAQWVAVWLMDRDRLLDGQLLNPARVADADWRLVGPR